MTSAPPKPAGAESAAPLHPARHWGGFLFSGATAFAVDAGILELGVRLLGLPAFFVRPFGIACAMLWGWLAHRWLTFAVAEPPSLRELGRYVLSATGAALVNYVSFVALLLAWPALGRMPALLVATCGATIFSYLSMRYGVFRRL